MRPVLALLTVTLALVACDPPTLRNGIKHGIVTTSAFVDAQGNVVQKVYAEFVDDSWLQPDFFQRDTCVVIQVAGWVHGYVHRDRDMEKWVGSVPTSSLTAGGSLTLQAAGETVSLPLARGPVGYEYTHVTPVYLPAPPGTPFSISIPGEGRGFPAAELESRFAEPISFDTTTATDDGLAVTWTPAPSPGSRVVVVLRAVGGTAEGAPTYDITCAAPDTGAFTMTREHRNMWMQGPAYGRSFYGVRMRLTRDEISRKTILFSVSNYRDTLPRVSDASAALNP